ncbi:MAG: hypothetical protein A3C03_01700 [Candidatus Colwellbacteria bacterium RIFCSPHIGHO2_02_FULL_45_17]|uniref:Transcriptional regulatory protein n=2 Tax=Candidatus Colwelliibacteriota TaxID=1817904 RepID=A0A1G1ZBD0_9BACT|nr:MAG: hypothetical protein A3C03_01700 [Candidatus Colwellbacteria bacterium RIFCSPHIGHO2_02_FULL_45_17]OGY60764.1 MAG: hypothetical protein A3I33_02215 [Candidatus Colwellbacteria bacterium RIFCSPLOWO2_02_FULL_45_11]OGY61958.1 MAG: hypothetical protein A3G58_00015 [Candidatus Colwellbacteria bacterium RIFCSPLOWO2_12_FULL_46_17]
MSGHNKWSKIKHKKATEDSGKSKLFSKLAKEIAIAARHGSDPQFNPTLRSAIDRARKQNMPQVNVERAIKKAEGGGDLEPILIEAYGPDGIGVIVEGATDNKNRTIGEVRVILKKYDSKIAEQGGLAWSFEKKDGEYAAKFPREVSEEIGNKIFSLQDELEEMDDILAVYTSIKQQQ